MSLFFSFFLFFFFFSPLFLFFLFWILFRFVVLFFDHTNQFTSLVYSTPHGAMTCWDQLDTAFVHVAIAKFLVVLRSKVPNVSKTFCKLTNASTNKKDQSRNAYKGWCRSIMKIFNRRFQQNHDDGSLPPAGWQLGGWEILKNQSS